jgi:lipopolysaccharide export system permease protein
MHRRPRLRRIDRYIFSQLLVALLLVTTGLVALIWLTQSLRFIQIIVSHGLSPFVFLRLTMLLVPSFVATILPITCFIVVLFIYTRLAGDRELTVMRAAGMSDSTLARPALLLATGTMLACYLLNLALVPASLAAFRAYEFEIRNQIAAFLLQPGVFTPVAGDVTVYVQARNQDDSLRGILIEDNRDPNAPATILARSGQLQVTAQGPEVLLEHGSREEVDPRTGRLDVLDFRSYTVSLAQASQADTPILTDSAEAPLAQLLHPPRTVTGPDRGKWVVEAHRRLSAPLAVMSFTLIGLFASLRGMFRRHGGIVRPFAAIVTVTLLVALGLGVNNLAARDLALWPLIWVTSLGPGLVAAVLLFSRQTVRS